MKNDRMQGATFCTQVGVLLTTGAVNTYDIDNDDIYFCINGFGYTLASDSGLTTPVNDANTGDPFPVLTANKGATAVWMVNADLEVSVAMSEVGDLDESGNFLFNPQYPPIPEDACPFAIQVLKAGSTAGTVTFGVSNWNATGFTNTVYDIFVMPDRPIG